MVFYLLKLVYNTGAVYINDLTFTKLAKRTEPRGSVLCYIWWRWWENPAVKDASGAAMRADAP